MNDYSIDEQSAYLAELWKDLHKTVDGHDRMSIMSEIEDVQRSIADLIYDGILNYVEN